MFAVIRGNAEGWGSTLIVSSVRGLGVLLAVFLVSQFVQEQAMFDVSLFRKPTFSGAALVAFALSAAMFAMFLYLVLYLQTILGLLAAADRSAVPALHGGLVLRRGGLGQPLGARPRALPARRRAGAVAVGLLLMRGLTLSSHWTALLPGFLVAGAGVGLVNPALASTAIGVVPPQRSGMASGINNTFRQVGIATGIAVLGAIFESAITSKLAPQLAGTAGRRATPPDRPSGRGRRRAAGARIGPGRAAAAGHARHPQRIRRGDERDPARRRHRRAGRRGARVGARADERLRRIRSPRPAAGCR